MKIEVEVVEMLGGEVTILEYDGTLFFQNPPLTEKKQEYKSTKFNFNPYPFRRH